MIDIFGNRLRDILGIEYSVIQGGMAWVSDHNLVAAVSKAGGLGTIGSGNMPADLLEEEIIKVQSQTDRPFAVNLMLLEKKVFEPQIEVAIEKKVPVVTLGAGNASSYVRKFHEKGIKVIGIAPSIAAAKRLAKREADAIVVEGNEAGGHIGRASTLVLLPEVVEALSENYSHIPIVAAGGICDGKSAVAAKVLGASGVQIGTRFVIAKETEVSDEVKKLYTSVSDVTKLAVTGNLMGLPCQCIKNDLTKEIEAMEEELAAWRYDTKKAGKWTKEKEREKIVEIETLAVGKLREAMQEGNVKGGSVMAGQCVIRLKEPHLNQPAAEIIQEIVRGASEILNDIYEQVRKGLL